LRGGDVDDGAGSLYRAVEDKMAAFGIAGGIPELIPRDGVAVAVVGRDQIIDYGDGLTLGAQWRVPDDRRRMIDPT